MSDYQTCRVCGRYFNRLTGRVLGPYSIEDKHKRSTDLCEECSDPHKKENNEREAWAPQN